MRSLQTKGRIIRRRSFLFIIPLALILAFAFSSCGSNGGTGAGGSTPTSAPTTAATPTIPIVGTADGCPNTTVVNTPQSKPDVVILATNSGTVTAHNGNLIEVRLPFGQRWSGPTTSQGILQLQQPAGYASQADKVCIWRFVAQGTGTQVLNFAARAICVTGQLCPQYVVNRQFTVDVK